MIMIKELLRMEEISYSTDGKNILKGARLNLFQDEVIGIIGVNHSGKTSLVGGLAGMFYHGEGRVYLEEQPIQITSIEQARSKGIFYLQKKSSLITEFSIMENFLLAAQGTKVLRNKKEMERNCRDAIELLGVQADIYEQVGKLSFKNRILTEIAKAVAYDVKILIFDNVLNSLSVTALEEFVSIFEMLKSLHISIILVDTGIKYLKSYCNRLFVMRGGQTVAVLSEKEIEENLVVSLMLGHRLKEEKETPPQNIQVSSKVMLEFKKVSYGKILSQLNFEVHENERAGILNINKNSGRAIENLFMGKIQPDSGAITFCGSEVHYTSTEQAHQRGMVTVPEQDIIFPELSLEENIAFSALKKNSNSFAVMNQHELRYIVRELIETYIRGGKGVYISDRPVPDSRLMRKKIVFCRALATNPKLMVLINPTQNIDVISKNKIYEDITTLKKKGITSLVISSDVQELLTLCERIIVINKGKEEKSITVDEYTREKLLYTYGKYLKNI